MEAEDIFLSVFYADKQSKIKGRIWLQKIIYILEKTLQLNIFEFKPYHYGGCSEEIIELQEEYRELGYIDEDYNGMWLKSHGLLEAKISSERVDARVYHEIEIIKKFANSLNENELIAFVYSQWENDASNSRIRDAIMHNRINIAMGMYKKSKVSLGRAAIIAGLSIRDFMLLLSAKKIEVIEAQ